MAVEEAVVIAVIGVILIEGLWLAALTWLMWRAKSKRAPAETEEATTST